MVRESRIDKMGVLILMSHLVITLVVLGLYGWTIFAGHEDDTLRTILTVIVGYWFGAMGQDAIKKRVVDKNANKREVE